MKRNLLTFGILIVVVTLWSFSYTDDKPISSDGIVFTEGNWEQTLAKAKTENKYIFVDVYASWCGICKKLKRKSFSDKEVGDYYNKNFINIAVNGESEEGRAIVNKYGIQGYPTLLIVDASGNIKTKQVGFMEPHILVNFGKRIVP